MGKYIKKHVWKPCEFIYKVNWMGKEPGDTCSVPSRRCHEGKYFCWLYNPKRVMLAKKAGIMKGIRTIARQEARLEARKKAYRETIDMATNTTTRQALRHLEAYYILPTDLS